jgi:hypothetical protein
MLAAVDKIVSAAANPTVTLATTSVPQPSVGTAPLYVVTSASSATSSQAAAAGATATASAVAAAASSSSSGARTRPTPATATGVSRSLSETNRLYVDPPFFDRCVCA